MPKNVKRTILLLIAATFYTNHPLAMMKTPEKDAEQLEFYKNECLEVKKFAVSGQFPVKCFKNYHHYNDRGVGRYRHRSAVNRGHVRIAGYNMLHPGSGKSIFKDYKLMASLINKWDVVTAIELLPLVSRDLKNNVRVVSAVNEGNISLSEGRSVYRDPGYLKILRELMRVDASWSLILSPIADAAKERNVKELVGFFYRSSLVRPVINEHCHEFKEHGHGVAYACLPNLRRSFMGRETSHVFSRRPFMSSFKSGNFDFTVLGSHVVHNSSSDEDIMARILSPSFRVRNYVELGEGVSLKNYARFAEVKVTLEFMERYRNRYQEKDIILASDTNLSASKSYWDVIMEEFPGGEVLITEATSISPTRYDRNGNPTGGFSSNYDHFVADPIETTECLKADGSFDAKRERYDVGRVNDYIMEHYNIKSESALAENNDPERVYQLTAYGNRKITRQVDSFEDRLMELKTIRNGEIVRDEYKFEEKIEAYKQRIFLRQLANETYYRFYIDLLSDHYPISMKCSTR